MDNSIDSRRKRLSREEIEIFRDRIRKFDDIQLKLLGEFEKAKIESGFSEYVVANSRIRLTHIAAERARRDRLANKPK